MSRFTRNNVMLSKAEVTYGTDPVPTGAQAILMSNPSFKLVNQTVDRNLVRPYFGNSEKLSGTKWIEHGGDVELVGSGTAGTAPAWDALLLACAFAKDVEAATRVDYAPLTDLQASVTNYVYRSGVLHKALGARGKVTINMKQGEIPKLGFQFLGLYGGVAAADPSGIDFSAFQVPQVVNNTNSTKLYLGSTVNGTGAPVITGGTQYPSLGLELDLGNEVPMTALVGGETIDVTDRKLSGKLTLDLTTAEEVAREADVLANTLQTVTFLHGTVAGKKVLVHAPKMQFTNPQYGELNGRLLLEYDLVGVPDGNGNNELMLTLF